MMQQLIQRYRRLRTMRLLARKYQYSYAFVGMGQHALSNLYPVLHYLGVPLKYVCVTSEGKARLIEGRFPGLTATTSMDVILSDASIGGVFVSASPAAHYALASQVLRSGKSLFVEKPPCRTLAELDELISLQRRYGSPVAMAGLQKRYAPAVRVLRRCLAGQRLVNYDLHYQTGPYPEGDALTELFIHPLDLVTYLFGKPEILACQRVARNSCLLMLRHPRIAGTLELSTACSWTSAEESLKVCTSRGLYRLAQAEELTFEPFPATFLGIPVEKVRGSRRTIEHLCGRNSFIPTLPNNQVHSQGYFGELSAFLSSVERGRPNVPSGISTLRPTYELLADIALKADFR